MSDGKVTDLFFLDEATALAAGYRPCGRCNKVRFDQLHRGVEGSARPQDSLGRRDRRRTQCAPDERWRADRVPRTSSRVARWGDDPQTLPIAAAARVPP